MNLLTGQQAVANWKRLQPAVMDGDQYRLVSPYETNHAAVEYVDKQKIWLCFSPTTCHPDFRRNFRQ